MKRGSTIFLRAAVLLIGATVLGLCLFALPVGIIDPHMGGYRPILLGLYVTAIPFFVALYQTLRLLNNIDQSQAFSDLSVKSLKYIRNCAVTICALFAAGMPYIYIVADHDDAPGVVAIGLVIIFASGVIATASGVLQALVQNAIDIKSENDLTV